MSLCCRWLSARTTVSSGYHDETATEEDNSGVPGGLEAQVTIEDQMKWDGKGSPPGAVEKVAPPTINTATLTDLQTDLTDLQTDLLCYMLCVCVCIVLGAWKSSLMAKGSPGKIRVPIQSNPTVGPFQARGHLSRCAE